MSVNLSRELTENKSKLFISFQKYVLLQNWRGFLFNFKCNFESLHFHCKKVQWRLFRVRCRLFGVQCMFFGVQFRLFGQVAGFWVWNPSVFVPPIHTILDWILGVTFMCEVSKRFWIICVNLNYLIKLGVRSKYDSKVKELGGVK